MMTMMFFGFRYYFCCDFYQLFLLIFATQRVLDATN